MTCGKSLLSSIAVPLVICFGIMSGCDCSAENTDDLTAPPKAEGTEAQEGEETSQANPDAETGTFTAPGYEGSTTFHSGGTMTHTSNDGI